MGKNKKEKRNKKEDLDQPAYSLTGDIIEVFNKCCSRRIICRRSRTWNTKDRVEKREKVKKNVREHKRFGTDSTREALMKVISELQKQIRNSRREYWNRFLPEAMEERSRE